MIAAPGACAILGVAHEPPCFEVPRGACDCHTHVFGPPARYPYRADRSYTPGVASVEQLLSLQRTLGLDRVVIVQPSPYGSDNRCTLDALQSLGERARGVVVIDDDTPADALVRMHAAGVRGVRINLETDGVDDPAAARRRFARASERVAPLGWHLQVYTRLPMLATLAPVIREHGNAVVLDHFGRAGADGHGRPPHLDVLLDLLADGRLWVKLSAPQRISATPDDEATTALARTLVRARPDRMLWGSDWPHPGAHAGRPRDPSGIEPFHAIDDGHALNRLPRWTESGDTLRAILVDNPARLYDFAHGENT